MTRTGSIRTETADDGSDPSSGRAFLYHVRYSRQPITAGNWLLANKASGAPTPGDPNTTQSMTVSNLRCGTTYYFRMKAFDEWGNGPLSNQVSTTTNAPLCTVNYCKSILERCTYTSTCGDGNCCFYLCDFDETCLTIDSPPPNACQ